MTSVAGRVLFNITKERKDMELRQLMFSPEEAKLFREEQFRRQEEALLAQREEELYYKEGLE